MSAAPPWLVPVVTCVADVLQKLRRRIVPRHYGAVELGTMSWVSQALAAFCELGLPQAMENGARTAEGLAAQGYGDTDRLFRLLRALAAYDVVEYCGNGRFALGHLGKALVGEQSAAPLIRYANAPWHVNGYMHLAEGIRANRSGFEAAEGRTMFEYFRDHAQAGEMFDGAMQALTPLFAEPFAAGYDFSHMQHVVDVGGGTGVLLEKVLARFAHLRGTVFELPSVVERMRKHERLAAVSGSILTDIPPVADAYIFSHILHDWNDESCLQMLRNVRQAMPPHARVLVYEIIVPRPNNRWSQDRISDIEMLAMLPGRERTREEYEALFERAGLRLNRVIATGAPESILEATPSVSP